MLLPQTSGSWYVSPILAMSASRRAFCSGLPVKKLTEWRIGSQRRGGVGPRRRLATSLPPIHLVAVIADTHLDATSTRHGHADPREFVALPAIAEKSHQMSSSNAHSVVALEGWDAR